MRNTLVFIVAVAIMSGAIAVFPSHTNAQTYTTEALLKELCPAGTTSISKYGLGFTCFDGSGNPMQPIKFLTGTQIQEAAKRLGIPLDKLLREFSGLGTTCSAFAPATWFQECIWIPLLSWLGSWFLTAGGGLVLLFGSIFQSLVDLVIIAFQKTLTDFGVLSRVDQWWVFVRNISNVLIIGFFTYIAVALILGLKEYGQKKLIARVLIVAILINFSLLFTKLVIDTSNYAAFQIYRTTSNQSQRFDLSKQFLEPIGITNIWDTKPVTDKAAEAAKGSSVGPAAAAFLYGLSGGFLLLLLTLVLIYGCWLLLGRAIALVVLMITAPFAFATYIIPRFAESEFGWSGWWRTLLNNAIFAPLFMIGLAVTFSILAASQHAASQSVTSAPQTLGSSLAAVMLPQHEGASAATSFSAQPQSAQDIVAANTAAAGSIAAIISDPKKLAESTAASGTFYQPLVMYLLGTGLLFVSLFASHKIAGSVGGFNPAKFALGLTAGGLALGARSLGFAQRNTIGAGARVAQRGKAAQARQNLTDAGTQRFAARQNLAAADRTGNIAEKNKLLQLAQQREQKARSLESQAAKAATKAATGWRASIGQGSFDATRTRPMSAALRAAGAGAFISGRAQERKDQKIEQRAQKVAEVVGRVVPNAEEARRQRDEIMRQEERERDLKLEQMKQEREDRQRHADVLKQWASEVRSEAAPTEGHAAVKPQAPEAPAATATAGAAGARPEVEIKGTAGDKPTPVTVTIERAGGVEEAREGALRRELQQTESTKSDMRHINELIEGAQTKARKESSEMSVDAAGLTSAKEKFAKLSESARAELISEQEKRVGELDKAMGDFQKESTRYVRDASRAVTEAQTKSVESLTAAVARKEVGFLGRVTGQDKAVASRAKESGRIFERLRPQRSAPEPRNFNAPNGPHA